MRVLISAVIFVIGFLIGSINPSIIISKAKGRDIRLTGSGNAGATNSLRAFGRKIAGIVLLCDVMKGVFACVIGGLTASFTGFQGFEAGLLLAGLGAVMGHNYPIYYGFRGGKGVASSFGVLIMLDWRIAIVALLIFAITVCITKYVSLGSILAAVSFGVMIYIPIFGGREWLFTAVSFAIILMLIFKHRGNISRIIKGTESKLGK